MAYAIIVPKDLKKITSDGTFDFKDYGGEMTKIYWNTSEKDKNIRRTVKTLENAVKGSYKGEGLEIPTSSGMGNLKITLDKGIIPSGVQDKVFSIKDLKGNTLYTGLSFDDLKNQFIKTKFVDFQQEANRIEVEGKRQKISELEQPDYEQ